MFCGVKGIGEPPGPPSGAREGAGVLCVPPPAGTLGGKLPAAVNGGAVPEGTWGQKTP